MTLARLAAIRDHAAVQVRLMQGASGRAVECLERIARVDDALELIASCIEHDADGALIDAALLPAEFFELRTRFAGEFLQKLGNYRMRLAVVFPAQRAYSERFEELLREARSGRGFRAFDARAEAEAWLLAS